MKILKGYMRMILYFGEGRSRRFPGRGDRHASLSMSMRYSGKCMRRGWDIVCREQLRQRYWMWTMIRAIYFMNFSLDQGMCFNFNQYHRSNSLMCEVPQSGTRTPECFISFYKDSNWKSTLQNWFLQELQQSSSPFYNRWFVHFMLSLEISFVGDKDGIWTVQVPGNMIGALRTHLSRL